MKYNLIPLCFSLLVVGCMKGKEVKILDGGATANRSNPFSPDLTKPTPTPVKPLVDASPEAKFCDKGQIYMIDLTVDNDYMDYRGKLFVDVLTLKRSKEIHLFFQEGQITKKEHLDLQKPHCEITSYINPKAGQTYKISGTVSSGDDVDKVENITTCREQIIGTSGIKNGEGIFTEISCSRIDFKELTVEDVREIIGQTNIKISGTAL